MTQTKNLFQVETPAVLLGVRAVCPNPRWEMHPGGFVPEGADPDKYLADFARSNDYVPKVLLGGVEVPASFWVIVDVSPKKQAARWWGEMTVELRAAIGEDGEPRCREVKVEASEPNDSVGLEMLRTIPVSNLLRIGVQWLVAPGNVDAVLKAWDAYRRAPKLPPSKANLRRVAEIVTKHEKAAAELGARARSIEAVQRELGLSRATAARRIKAARDRGYIKVSDGGEKS